MTDFAPYAATYRTVLEMAGTLSSTLDGGAGPSVYAIERLCDAVDAWASPVQSDRQGFSGGGGIIGQPDSAEVNLALAAADAQLMTVMFEASRAVGEQKGPADPRVLRQAVDAAHVQLESLEAVSTRTAFGARTTLPPSDSLEQAAARFREQSEAVFGVIIDECDNTIGAAAKSIRDKSDKILEIVGTIGKLLPEATPRIPLMKRAWNLLMSCVARMRAIVDAMPPGQLKAVLTSVLGDISVRSAVERVLGSAAARTTIAAFRLGAPLTIADVDRATEEILALGPRFSSVAASARIVVTVLTLSAATIAAQVSGPAAAIVVPGAYGLVVAGTLGLALDFTDRGSRVNLVTGVLQIGHALEEKTPIADGV